MSTPYLSEIKLFAFNFPPKGWAFCAGQILSIQQNQALFALLGTTYGGNGISTFGLPNLQSRVPISIGQGPGLSFYSLGDQAGVEAVTLDAATLGAHTHAVDPTTLKATIPCRNDGANQRGPSGGVPAVEATSVTATYSTASPDSSESTAAIVPAITAGTAGGNQPHTNIQPYLTVNYCIALQGIFPSRS